MTATLFTFQISSRYNPASGLIAGARQRVQDCSRRLEPIKHLLAKMRNINRAAQAAAPGHSHPVGRRHGWTRLCRSPNRQGPNRSIGRYRPGINESIVVQVGEVKSSSRIPSRGVSPSPKRISVHRPIAGLTPLNPAGISLGLFASGGGMSPLRPPAELSGPFGITP